jgi:hypothetical protein
MIWRSRLKTSVLTNSASAKLWRDLQISADGTLKPRLVDGEAEHRRIANDQSTRVVATRRISR